MQIVSLIHKEFSKQGAGAEPKTGPRVKPILTPKILSILSTNSAVWSSIKSE
jgi:hypothetical protein